MKIGFRKPSIKRSIKARTTGALKRKVKSTVNPFYGKKGIDYITDPKKAIYNKIYHKATFGVSDVAKAVNTTEPVQEPVVEKKVYSPTSLVIFAVLTFVSLIANIMLRNEDVPRVISAIVFIFCGWKTIKQLILKFK